MPTLFTQIINRDLPGHLVAETADYVALLDRHPMTLGHTLVVPRKEVDYLFDLDETLLAGLMLFAKQVAAGLQKVVPCLRIGMAVVGLEVPHAHLHLVPLNDSYTIDFKKPKLRLSQEELARLADELRGQWLCRSKIYL